MPTMTTEHSTNLILDDLASRNDNWVDINYAFDGSTSISPSIKAYTEPYVTLSATGGALTVDLSSGSVFKINMTSTITSIAYSGDSTSETVPFTLQFYPLSTATLTITGQTAYAVCTASTSLTATSSCGFTGVFSTLVEPGDRIDVSGFSTATNNTVWRVMSASTAFIAVRNSSGLTSTSSTAGTISRRRDIFAGGSSGFNALTPYTPTAYVGYTFDGDRFYMAAVGDM